MALLMWREEKTAVPAPRTSTRTVRALTGCLALSLLTMGGCAGTPVGTDGNAYAKANDGSISSAAHDLACPREQVHIVSATIFDGVIVVGETIHNTERLYILEGCGARVSYAYSCGFPECRYLLLSRLDLGQAPPRPPPAASP